MIVEGIPCRAENKEQSCSYSCATPHGTMSKCAQWSSVPNSKLLHLMHGSSTSPESTVVHGNFCVIFKLI